MDFIRFACAALFSIIAVFLAVIAMAQFDRNNTTVHPQNPSKTVKLVTGGVYRLSRNPMYLALTLLLVAWGIWLANGYSLLLVPLFMWCIYFFQISAEEQVLEASFGEDYQNYRNKVRRWV